MGFLSSCKTFLFYLGTLLGPSIDNDGLRVQQPLGGSEIRPGPSNYGQPYPRFPAPHGPYKGEPFKCSYPSMVGWKDCSTSDNRQCWLQGPNGQEFNISTNYELFAPKGIQRNVSSLLATHGGAYI